MPGTVWLNNEYLPRERAVVSVDDRGFVFGDGVYEVTRVVNGEPFEEDRHLARLRRGVEALRLAPDFDVATIREASRRLLDANGLRTGEGSIYVQVTRGVAPRAHVFPKGTPPTMYVSVSPFTPNVEMRTRGAGAITTPDIRWSRCDLKVVNLLPNVLAKQAAAEAGAFEAIFVRNGAVTEGAHTNVFAVINGELRTYPECNYILSGVTRTVVVELAGELGIPLREAPFFAEDLRTVEELMVVGTLTDVLPIVQLDGRPVAGGKPGPVARRLYEALRERMGAPAAVAAR
jgi:D-alanine transaminase